MDEDKLSVILALSCDVLTPVQLRVAALDGRFQSLASQSAKIDNPNIYKTLSKVKHASELYATVQLFDGNNPLSLPVQTIHSPPPKEVSSSVGRIFATQAPYRRVFDQWLSLSAPYNLLPRNCRIELSFWEYEDGRPVLFGSAATPLFELDGSAQRGHKLLPVRLNSVRFDPVQPSEAYETDRKELEALVRRLELAQDTDWATPLVSRKIDKLARKLASTHQDRFTAIIELVNFDVTVIYSDTTYDRPISGPESGPRPRDPVQLIDIDSVNDNMNFNIQKVYDPEQFNDLPIELKYHQLERSLMSTSYKRLADRNLKPNLEHKRRLNAIVGYSLIRKLDNNEKNLVYKFRYYLVNGFKLNSFALDSSNFLNFLLKSIDWENANETAETRDILSGLVMNKLKISLTNTLELLGPVFDSNTLVRDFAVSNLRAFDDHDINLYLLQLIQALKFDDYVFSGSVAGGIPGSREEMASQLQTLTYNGPEASDFEMGDIPQVDSGLSPLANFLITKAVNNRVLGNYFYWYSKLESKDPENSVKVQLVFKRILKAFVKALKSASAKREEERVDERLISQNNSSEEDPESTETEEDHGIYGALRLNITRVFEGRKLVANITLEAGIEMEYLSLQEQIGFMKKISQLTQQIGNMKKTTPEKQQALKSILSKNESGYRYFDNRNTVPLPLPLNPEVQVLYVIPEHCTVFKSSLSPLKLTFKTVARKDENGEYQDTYLFMYKVGDDLRQDQLVIQVIKLIEKLLKDENLNLELNPYEILATGLNEGMIEFIPNLTLDKVLNKYQNIINFFKSENPYGDISETPQEDSREIVKDVISKNKLEQSIAEAINDTGVGVNPEVQGVHPKIMENFVKSCAGYCVITYLLGIGDRHLDNLLICRNGKFFHVDFGYILGKDPKPFPPLMKLPIEIIDGFGGLNSKFFQDFKNYCFVCFLTLRKNSNLILNLLELMTFGNIPDLKVDSKNSILKVQEKFMLDLSDEEAIVYFQNLINDSVNAFLPVVIDKLHSLAQYWRA